MTSIRPPRPHFHVLLDRSGSMATMRDDVVGGFNALLAEQQAAGGDARLTVVRFDSVDAQEVVVDARPIDRVAPLGHDDFVPRGGTPLLDATGRLIASITARLERRRHLGKRPEITTVITVTDGHENQSCEYRRDTVRALVRDRQVRGWTFAFLGAGLDSYSEAGGIGYDARSVMNFAPDGAGAAAAFANVSRAMTARRDKVLHGEEFSVEDFYEGDKAAEDDLRRRHG